MAEIAVPTYEELVAALQAVKDHAKNMKKSRELMGPTEYVGSPGYFRVWAKTRSMEARDLFAIVKPVLSRICAASPTPPSIGVTLPSEEAIQEMAADLYCQRGWGNLRGRGREVLTGSTSLREFDQCVKDIRAILQLIERKTGRKP